MASRSGSIEPIVLAGHVVVGRSSATPDLDHSAFDVLVTDVVDPPRPWVHASLDALATAVHASPFASITLVQVLRASEGSSVVDGLSVESMAYSMLQHGVTFTSWLQRRGGYSRRAVDEHEPVRLERAEGRLDIVLQRPAVHNALSARMRDALCDAFELVALDATITDVHVRGEGPSFCSGGDLSEFGMATDAAAAHLLRLERSVGRRIDGCADRTTVHLHGTCLGAGIELAAFAGRVLAEPDTTIGLPEVAMGLIPGAGGTVSVPRRIGRHRTAYLALTGARIATDTARAWGLVDAIEE